MEVPVTIIAVERVILVTEVGDVDGRLAGMVVVPDSNTHRSLLGTVFTNSGTGFEAYICEFAISIVAVKVVRSGIIGDIHVRTASIIEICPHHSHTVIAGWVIHAGAL